MYRSTAARVLARLPGARGAASALQTLRFRWRHRGRQPVVVVHQMARVGSISVLRAIRRSAPTHNVFHTHYLAAETIRHFEAQADRTFAATRALGVHRELLAARWLTARLHDGVRQRWRIVSLVRDPIARTISAFFRHFPYSYPQLGAPFVENAANVRHLMQLFQDDSAFEHDFALGWFDREMRDVFGVDVYAAPFPHAAGYATYAGEMCDVLVMRLEDLDRVGARALEDFLGLRDLTLGTANAAEREPYAASYRRFLAELRLTPEYLDRMYESRLARHFYTREERARFRQRWLRPQTSDL